MPVLKKCYYDVLGIERTATDDDVKKAFRKLALQLHPDKNPDRLDEAKSEFQLLQQAYEVLSNPQERAWYDEHRHAVLRGGLNEDFEDDSIDLMPYCMSSCYSGFGDDEGGFYSVYRNLFEKIAAEEIEAGFEESDGSLTSFGDSRCSYEEVVGPFYAFWESFCTQKHFSWLDEFDTRRAGCRKVSRLMDKENKKLRLEAKRDWNQRVRALVDFAKRKDKRVQAWKLEQEIKLKKKEEALAQKFADDKAKRLQERKKLLDSLTKENGRTISGSESQAQLKEIENWMANEFGEGEEASEDEDETYHCEVCNKVFRTANSFSSHERSKRHVTLMQSRELTKKDSELLSNDDTVIEAEELDEEVLDCEQELYTGTKVNGKFSETNDKIGEDSKSEVELNRTDNSDIESDDNKDKLQKMDNFKVIKPTIFEGDEIEGLTSLMSETFLLTNCESKNESTEETPKLKKKRRANKGNKIPADAGIIETIPEVPKIKTCIVCKENFKSRTALFEHLKLTKHAVPLDDKSTTSKNLPNDDFNDKERNKKGKGKGRRR